MGIGFDQLLILQKKKCLKAQFHYRIFNANGLEVEQCGNGARCIAYFLFIKKKMNYQKICLSTQNRYLYLEHIEKNIFKVDMGEPLFSPSKIPFFHTETQSYYNILINNKKLYFSVVSIGNPHCVIQVNDIRNYPVDDVGFQISQHSLFPKGVNVGFMQIISKKKILLRVYERHVGETQACGSGACAAVAVGIRNKLLSKTVKVHLSNGKLSILWDQRDSSSLYMIGPASHVYDGYILPD